MVPEYQTSRPRSSHLQLHGVKTVIIRIIIACLPLIKAKELTQKTERIKSTPSRRFFLSIFLSRNLRFQEAVESGILLSFVYLPLTRLLNSLFSRKISWEASKLPRVSNGIQGADVEKIMQLYHHPFSLDSQKVRLALEEKGIDYTSFHVNPLTGKNMDASFFKMNPTAKLPVFQNGAHIIFETIEIIQYIDRVAVASSGENNASVDRTEVMEWMRKIQGWKSKIFTLSHVPEKYRLFISRFVRRVVIARMAEAPELASVYHLKLREAYEMEDKIKDPTLLKQSEQQLACLLDDAETQLSETVYLAGQEFTVADSMFVPVLARIALLNLEEEYISSRPKIAEYWKLVQDRASYRKVIGNYFSGWRKYKTLFKTWCFVRIRSLLRRY